MPNLKPLLWFESFILRSHNAMMPDSMAAKAARSASEKKNVIDASMRIVVLQGKERYLMHEHTRSLIEALEARFGGVEQFAFDGEIVPPATVLDELRSYGLMQKHKLVIVDSADVFLAGGAKPEDVDEEEEKKSGPPLQRKLLEKYAEKPVDDATLLLRAETWRPGKIDKLIAKVGTIIACEEQSAQSAVGWCIKRVAKRYDATIDRDAAELLVARHGSSLSRLDTELLKLSALTGSGGVITRLMVEQNTIVSREEKFWFIQDAIVTGDPAIMLRKLHELMDVSKQDVVPLTWSAGDFLRKVHAASVGIRQGIPSNALFGQLKLWGNSGQAVIDWGRRLEPSAVAQLLQAAVDADRRSKSGLGEPVRNLEALMVTIADSVNA